MAAIGSNPMQLQSHPVDVDLYRLRAHVHRIWRLAMGIANICIIITVITPIVEMHNTALQKYWCVVKPHRMVQWMSPRSSSVKCGLQLVVSRYTPRNGPEVLLFPYTRIREVRASLPTFGRFACYHICGKLLKQHLPSKITQEFTPHPTQFGFRTYQSIDSALLLAESAMKSGSHAGILDLRKAYDSVDRHFLLQRCTQVLSPNTTGMIQSSLGKVILHTMGDVSNTYGVSTIGVVQGSSCSPPLFNIFIDPLAEELHKTALTLPDNPKNALLADDVAVYAKIASSMQALLDVCSTRSHQYNMSWNARKSHILISNHTPFANNSFTLKDEILPITTSVKYLGVTLSGKGIGAKKSIQRTESARSALTRLIDSGIISPVLKPQRVLQIFTTFVRSKYVYALAHIPLSQQLLEKDNELVNMLYRSLLRLHTLPTKKQRNLLNGFYRLRSLQLIKEEASHSLASKILDRSMSENALTRTLAERDKSIINTRDIYNKLYRALLDPLNPKQVQHRRFVQWNYARHGLRWKPAPFTPEKWPLATLIGQNNPTLRLMAMRWHLGRFPLNIDQDPLSDDRQHFLILHSMFKTPHKEISTRHIQAVEDSITHFLNQHNQ